MVGLVVVGWFCVGMDGLVVVGVGIGCIGIVVVGVVDVGGVFGVGGVV